MDPGRSSKEVAAEGVEGQAVEPLQRAGTRDHIESGRIQLDDALDVVRVRYGEQTAGRVVNDAPEVLAASERPRRLAGVVQVNLEDLAGASTDHQHEVAAWHQGEISVPISDRGQQGIGGDADRRVHPPNFCDGAGRVRAVDDVVMVVEDEAVLPLTHGDGLEQSAGALVNLVNLGFTIVARVEDGLRPGRDRPRPGVGGGDGVLSDPGAGVARVDHPDGIRAHREPDVPVRPGTRCNALRDAAPCREQTARLQGLENRRSPPPAPRSLPPSPSPRIRPRIGPDRLPPWDAARHGLSPPRVPQEAITTTMP